MEKRDLDVAAHLFEVACDGDNDEHWTRLFQDHIAQAMKRHSSYLRNAAAGGGVAPTEKKLEVLRARLELHEIVSDRLECRASKVDPGLAEAFGMLRNANRPIMQDVFELQTHSTGSRLSPRSSSPPRESPIRQNVLESQIQRGRDRLSVRSKSPPLESPGQSLKQSPHTSSAGSFHRGNGSAAFATASNTRRGRGCESTISTPETVRYFGSPTSAGYSPFSDVFDSSYKGGSLASGSVQEQSFTPASSKPWQGPRGGGSICSGDGGDGRRSPKTYGTIHGGQLAKDLASRPNKELTLRQLREIMTSVFSSKAQHDQRCREAREPLQTLEQHLYSYLSKRYGIKSVVQEWAQAVFRTIQRFASREVDVLVFGKILQNTLAESFVAVQDTLRSTVQTLLRDSLQQRNQQRAPSEIDALWRTLLRSGVPLSDCEQVVRHMYNEIDCDVVIPRLHALTDAGEEQSQEDTSNSRRQQCDIVRYRDFLHVLLTFQMQLTDGFLADFLQVFRLVDTDDDGIICGPQLDELVHRLALLPDGENPPQGMAALDEAAHSTRIVMGATRQATFSECVDLCTPLISARWGALSEDPAQVGDGSDSMPATEGEPT